MKSPERGGGRGRDGLEEEEVEAEADASEMGSITAMIGKSAGGVDGGGQQTRMMCVCGGKHKEKKRRSCSKILHSSRFPPTA